MASDKEFKTRSEEETIELAKELAREFKGDEVVLLEGELGAGKTVFAKGIAAGLGMQNIHDVCSPSFTLVNVYEAEFPIYHVDLFRLESESEILDLGWEEFQGNGIIIVEWAEKLRIDLGKAIRVKIETGNENERCIRIS